LAGVQVLRGLTFGAYTSNAMTFAVESGDERTRGSHSGLFNTVSGMGQLAGLLLGGTLAQAGGFTFMFGVFAVTALLSGACFLMLRRRSMQPAEAIQPVTGGQ
jgi:MFS family permease